MKTENNESQNNVENTSAKVSKAIRPLWMEVLLSFLVILLSGIVGPLLVGLKAIKPFENDIFEFTYSANSVFKFSKSLALTALIASLITLLLLVLLMVLIKPSGLKPDQDNRLKNYLSFGILSVFGILAYLVITMLLSTKLSGLVSIILAVLLAGIYDVLVYKMYLERRSQSNFIFWEIFRFAIVGLVAAVFDFLTCYLVQFIFFGGNDFWYVTMIATFCGFIIGVTINYLMSTYMVYKDAHSNFGKTTKGIILFVVLSTIGLGIGIGLQYFTYDFLFVSKGILFFSYPIDFIIRTLVVMVYNYLTRKIFIYR